MPVSAPTLVAGRPNARRGLRSAVASGLAVLLLFFGFWDALTTEATLALGAGVEANPLVARMQELMGIAWILPKMMGHGLLAWMVVRRPTLPMLAAMTLLTLVLAIVTGGNFGLLTQGVIAYALLVWGAAL